MDKLFFGIPDELFRDVFVPFLSLKDLVALDSAALNHSLRLKLVDKLRGVEPFEVISIDLYDDVANWLRSRGVYVKHIKVSQDNGNDTVISLGNALSHVMELDLSGCTDLSKKAFETLSKECKSLAMLHMKECNAVSDKLFASLGQAFSNLTHLDLSDSEKVSSYTLQSIVKYCDAGKLSTLRLGGCKKIDDDCFVPLPSSLTSLTGLDLGGSKVSDLTLQAVAIHCKSLRILDIQDCRNITDAGVLHLVSLSKTLQEVNFFDCVDLSDHSMLPLVEACHELRFFGIGSCDQISDLCVETLIRNNACLTECDFSFTELSGETIVALATTCCGLLNLDILNCKRIDSYSIATLLLCCTELKTLNIGENDQFDSSVAEAILRGSKELVDLSACACADIVSDEFLLSLCARCPNLMALNLTECCALTDVGIIGMAQSLPKLLFLDLTGCVEITDASLHALQVYCPALVAVQVVNCRNLTSKAIDSLTEMSSAAVTY